LKLVKLGAWRSEVSPPDERQRILAKLPSKVWFLEALQPHGGILVSAYNFSADQPAV